MLAESEQQAQQRHQQHPAADANHPRRNSAKSPVQKIPSARNAFLLGTYIGWIGQGRHSRFPPQQDRGHHQKTTKDHPQTFDGIGHGYFSASIAANQESQRAIKSPRADPPARSSNIPSARPARSAAQINSEVPAPGAGRSAAGMPVPALAPPAADAQQPHQYSDDKTQQNNKDSCHRFKGLATPVGQKFVRAYLASLPCISNPLLFARLETNR